MEPTFNIISYGPFLGSRLISRCRDPLPQLKCVKKFSVCYRVAVGLEEKILHEFDWTKKNLTYYAL